MTKFEEEVKRPKKAYIDPFSKRDVDFTGVAKKFTEGAQTLKEWKEYAFLLEDKLKLQQQALPVVPECVGNYISGMKENGENIAFAIMCNIYNVAGEGNEKAINWKDSNQEVFARAWLDGYTVEKPQLFKLIFPNSTAVLQKDGELNSFADTVYKRYLIGNAMTEQEIKSIDERYWQFAVPVEDGE